MLLPLSRGRISHTVLSECGWFLRALASPLTDFKTVTKAEESFASYVGRQQCIVFPFARTAIWSTLKAQNLPRGSRIVLPPLTIKPILDVVVHMGYEPLFVDINPDTACFDEQNLRMAMTEKPAVAILTYLFGLVPDVGRLMQILREHNVFVIEDFSQCLNGEFDGQRIGTFGDVSVYSASSVKTLDTFGGGFALTDSQMIAKELRRYQAQLTAPKRVDLLQSIARNLLRNLASTRVVFATLTFWALQFVARRSPTLIGRFTGARSTEPLSDLPAAWFRQYTSVQAAVALRELPRVRSRDEKRVSQMEAIAASAHHLKRPRGQDGQKHVYWQFILYVDNFASAREHFAKLFIDCATTSLVLLTDLPKYPGQVETPVGRRLYELGVYLPCYHQLKDSESRRISAALKGLLV
jgi:perosamine synthetase